MKSRAKSAVFFLLSCAWLWIMTREIWGQVEVGDPLILGSAVLAGFWSLACAALGIRSWWRR